MAGSSEDGGSCAVHLEDLDVPEAIFGCPDLPTLYRQDELGPVVVGPRLAVDFFGYPLGSVNGASP